MGDISRIGCMASTYSRIAMLNYLKGKELIERCTDYGNLLQSTSKIDESIIITVVLSAMAIESFFNDYAARKFSDKFFEENLDRLQPTSKIQIIAKFAFQKEIKKGDKMFQLISNLFKRRNEFVHNKSKSGFGSGMSKEESLEFEKVRVSVELLDLENEFTLEKEAIMKDLQESYKAISAIYEVVKYFEANDDESYSKFMLLCTGYTNSLDDKEKTMINKLHKEFGLPECRVY